MKNITIIDRKQVRFYKMLWNEAEIILAKCFEFTIDADKSTVTANIIGTNKKSLYDFIRISFKNFSESVDEEHARNAFFAEVDAIYEEYALSVKQLCAAKLPYHDRLYAHQFESITFALPKKVAFLALQMRLGKSIIAATLSRLTGVKRTLIICPSSAKMGWFHGLTSPQKLDGGGSFSFEFNQLFFTILDASKSKMFIALNERFVIVNYDVLDKYMKHILSMPIGHVIIDEAHRLKARFSNRFKNVERILLENPDTRVTYLSGTPIPNRFNDLFAYFKLSGHYLGESYKKFTDEFTIKSQGRGGEKVTGARNIAELKIKMSNFMFVKTMDECFDMPEDVLTRYTFQLDDYRDEYNEVIRKLAEEENNLSALNGHIHSLNIVTCKSKIKGIIEIIEDIVEETGKVVVFGTYKEPLGMLEKHFGNRCVKVVGGISSHEKNRLRDEFTNNPDVQIFLGNYEAAGEGIDLSVSSDFLAINFPLTPRELNQAKFRCKHTEKKSHLRLHYTFCEDSIDEHIYDNIIIDKEKDINNLIHDGKDVDAREDITQVLIKKILKKEPVEETAPEKVSAPDPDEAFVKHMFSTKELPPVMESEKIYPFEQEGPNFL